MVFPGRRGGDSGSAMVAELPIVMLLGVAITAFLAAIPMAHAIHESREDARELQRQADWALAAALSDPAFLAEAPSGLGVFDAEKLSRFALPDAWPLLEADLARDHHMRILVRDVSEYSVDGAAILLDLRSTTADPAMLGDAASASAPVAVVYGDREVHAARLVLTLWEARLA